MGITNRKLAGYWLIIGDENQLYMIIHGYGYNQWLISWPMVAVMIDNDRGYYPEKSTNTHGMYQLYVLWVRIHNHVCNQELLGEHPNRQTILVILGM